MTEAQMREALEWKSKADRLRKKIDTFVLLKRDDYTKEVVCLGEPKQFSKSDYFRVEVPLPDELRRYAFRLWKRETTLEYNKACRKLAQLGLSSEHTIIPVPEAQP